MIIILSGVFLVCALGFLCWLGAAGASAAQAQKKKEQELKEKTKLLTCSQSEQEKFLAYEILPSGKFIIKIGKPQTQEYREQIIDKQQLMIAKTSAENLVKKNKPLHGLLKVAYEIDIKD